MERQPVPGTEQYSYRKDRAIPSFSDEGPIFVFDGQCAFCSGWVKFALKHDKAGKYRFMTAQSQVGSALYRHHGLEDRDFKTNLFLRNGRAYLRGRHYSICGRPRISLDGLPRPAPHPEKVGGRAL
jgi:hypothetical protein